MKYDPNESMYPPIGEPIRVEIMRCEETESSTGRDMMIVHAAVCPGQPGGGYETKFYALSFHLRDILAAVGMANDSARDVDALTFRGCTAMVLFKKEAYRNKDGEDKTATKIDRWLPVSDGATVTEISENGDVREQRRQQADDDDIPF